MDERITVYVSLDREDLEKLIEAWGTEFEDKMGYSHAYDPDARPVVYKLYEFLKRWEELNEKERVVREVAKKEVKPKTTEKAISREVKAV